MHVDKEVLIVRNTAVNRLYDLVFIVKGVQYDQAVAMMLELEEN